MRGRPKGIIPDIPCAVCGSVFTPSREQWLHRTEYKMCCGSICAKRTRSTAPAEHYTANCAYCGSHFETSRYQRKKLTTLGSSTLLYCDAHSKIHEHRGRLKSETPWYASCGQCGDNFKLTYDQRRTIAKQKTSLVYCTNKCRYERVRSEALKQGNRVNGINHPKWKNGWFTTPAKEARSLRQKIISELKTKGTNL